MPEHTYPPPVAQLLSLGRLKLAGSWLDYASLGIGPEHVADLIRVLLDEDLLFSYDETEACAPIHAWRALGQFGAVEAIEPLLSLLHLTDDEGNDWVGEECSVVLGMIGPPAIPAVSAYLADAEHGEWAGAVASDALRQIAVRHPEARDDCVAALMRQLESYEAQNRSLNASLIYDLVQLHAVEAAPLMERAFEADVMDLALMGDWEDAQIELGLLEQRITPRPRWDWDGYRIESEPRSAQEQREVRRERQRAPAKEKGQGETQATAQSA